MKALGYIRLSRANENGVSLAAQRRAIEEACEARGWELVEVVEDKDKSGATLKRPGVLRAIDRLDAGQADVLVVARLDRLSRSIRDFANLLHDAEWKVIALDVGFDTTTPQGEAMVNMLMVFAQLERKLIGQRTKTALAEKQAQGVRIGRPREVSDKTAKRVCELRRNGRKQRSLSEIARTLNAEGTPTPRGGLWHPSSVKRVLSWERS